MLIKNKFLVINADDFGLTKGISEGIMDGYENGCITSTSMIVNFSSAQYAANLFQKCDGLGIGLHFNVTKGKPICDSVKVSSLLDENGEFHSSSWYFNELNRVDEDELILELDAQYQRFVELLNRQPDHFDIHHVYDFYNNYPKFYQYVLNLFNVPIRMDVFPNDFNRTKICKIDTMMDEQVDIDRIGKFINKTVDKNLYELPLHPGYVDDELINLSSMTYAREKDLEFVKDKSLKDKLEEYGIELIDFKTMKEKGYYD